LLPYAELVLLLKRYNLRGFRITIALRIPFENTINIVKAVTTISLYSYSDIFGAVKSDI